MLSLTVYRLGDTTLFRCTGRLVSSDSEYLRDAVLTHPQARSVVLDLAEIDSVDAAGLGMLLSLRARAKKTGTSFKLMNLTPRVEEVFEITKLSDKFEVCSVPEMLDLLCRAARQTRAIAVLAEMPLPLTGPATKSDCRSASDPAA
jgi:anti-anti-sigma factor